MSAFTPKPKIIILSLASAFSTLTVANVIETSAQPEQYQELDTVVVSGKRTNDQKGADDVYYKNVSNAYVGKEYLERYRVQSAGDVLKGLNGVYNMNTRTAGGAITPNIRGITGKGRIPVTLDGTEQTVDVWLNNYGVGDRNYLDPALFRSIAVEKSPALTRGVNRASAARCPSAPSNLPTSSPKEETGESKSKPNFPATPWRRKTTCANS